MNNLSYGEWLNILLYIRDNLLKLGAWQINYCSTDLCLDLHNTIKNWFKVAATFKIGNKVGRELYTKCLMTKTSNIKADYSHKAS